MRGKGVGELLLTHALWRSKLVSQQAAVYAVEVDAFNDKAKDFYKSYGFVSLLDNAHHMYLLMKTIDGLDLLFDSDL